MSYGTIYYSRVATTVSENNIVKTVLDSIEKRITFFIVVDVKNKFFRQKDYTPRLITDEGFGTDSYDVLVIKVMFQMG